MQPKFLTGAITILLGILPATGFAQVKDPGFIFEDFNNDGFFEAGVDLKLEVDPNWTPRNPNMYISIWNSDAGSEAGAGIVIPPSARTLNAGRDSKSSVFVYTDGKLRIGRGVFLRASSVSVTGNLGIVLDHCSLISGNYLSVEGPLEAVGVTMRAIYIFNYHRESAKIDRSLIVGDSSVLVAADNGRADITRTTIRAGWIMTLRGELHAESMLLASSEIDIEPAGETGPGGLSMIRSSVVLGTGGRFSMRTSWFPEEAQPLDLSKTLITGPYSTVDLCGKPCLLDARAVRGPGVKVTVTP